MRPVPPSRSVRRPVCAGAGWIAGLVPALALLPALAGAQGEEARMERGQQIAEERCAFCHQVTPMGESAIEAAAPSFMEIANMPGRDAESLQAFFEEFHPVETVGDPAPLMPTILLNDPQRDAVVTYILSFQDR